jgi:hypothetical protein
MLLFHRPTADQVGAIDLNRARRGRKESGWTDAAEAFLPRRVNRPYLLLSILLLSILPVATLAKEKAKEKVELLSPSASPGEQSLSNIPLVVGHEAKGLVLPDFDLDGHLRGKFEAGTARRIDNDHVGFGSLKITTYTPENTADLTIEMNNSVFDLKTRVLTSRERTSIKRADFNITGDSVEFDTNARTGKLIGNVKMVITDQTHFSPKTSE